MADASSCNPIVLRHQSILEYICSRTADEICPNNTQNLSMIAEDGPTRTPLTPSTVMDVERLLFLIVR